MTLVKDHPIRCRCGQVQGVLSAGAPFTRAVCYCRDCQAYARALGDAGRTLDANGGTDIVATLHKFVRFTSGTERLACLSLTPRGLLRWYAACCDTPIANTPRDSRLSYAGLVHTGLSRETRSLDADFGLQMLAINAKSAQGTVPSSGIRTITATLRIMGRVMRARMDGSWRQSPFFDSELRPVANPRIIDRRPQ